MPRDYGKAAEEAAEGEAGQVDTALEEAKEMAEVGASKSMGMRPMSAGTASGGGAASTGGPTSSSRSYPKGSSTPGNSQDAPFNPQKVAATKIYVGGV